MGVEGKRSLETAVDNTVGGFYSFLSIHSILSPLSWVSWEDLMLSHSPQQRPAQEGKDPGQDIVPLSSELPSGQMLQEGICRENKESEIRTPQQPACLSVGWFCKSMVFFFLPTTPSLCTWQASRGGCCYLLTYLLKTLLGELLEVKRPLLLETGMELLWIH